MPTALSVVWATGTVSGSLSDPTSTLSYNRYAYANYNPLTEIDPTGFDDCFGGASCDFPLDEPALGDIAEPDINFTLPPTAHLPQEFYDPSTTTFFATGAVLYGGVHPTQTYTPETLFDGNTGDALLVHYGHDFFAGAAVRSNYLGRFNPDTGIFSSAFGDDSWFSPGLSASLGTDALKWRLAYNAGIFGTLNYLQTRALPMAAGILAAPLLAPAAGANRGAEAGEALVYRYAGSHFSVEVRAGEEILHTEQVMLAEGKTTGAIRESADAALQAFRIALPDARAALAAQRASLGADLEEYSLGTNSCLTYCGNILRSGGLDVPSTSIEIARWLRTLQLQ